MAVAATSYWTRTGAGLCRLLIKEVSDVLRQSTASAESFRHVCLSPIVILLNSSSLSCFVTQVQGKSASDHYLVFPEHYCSCQAFFYEVVNIFWLMPICQRLHPNQKLLTLTATVLLQCKHQIAAKVSDTYKRCPVTVVPYHVLTQIQLES